MRFFISCCLTVALNSLLFGQYSNVTYQSHYTNSTYNRSISTSLPVGTTPGTHEVSLSGGAVYNIPIATPPGTGNMVPSVSIGYNSQGGDGHLGMGWSISGMSAITRANKDLFHDTEVKSVQMDNTDQFALDGNRLVVVSGSYGANNSVYYTKSETFSRITSYGSSGGGPTWFKVETKSGITYEYGNSTDSRMVQEGGAAVMFWMLNKAYDCFGNYIEYKYKTDERDMRIDEINYTGNAAAGLLPYNKIKFTYGYRTDKNTGYMGGSSLNSNFLLTKITVTAENSSAFKEYLFTYGYSINHSFLRDVEEKGDNGTASTARCSNTPMRLPLPSRTTTQASYKVNRWTFSPATSMRTGYPTCLPQQRTIRATA